MVERRTRDGQPAAGGEEWRGDTIFRRMTESWHIPYSTLVLHCVRLSTAASGSSQARDTHSSQLSTIMGERTRRLADDAQPVDTDIQTVPRTSLGPLPSPSYSR